MTRVAHVTQLHARSRGGGGEKMVPALLCPVGRVVGYDGLCPRSPRPPGPWRCEPSFIDSLCMPGQRRCASRPAPTSGTETSGAGQRAGDDVDDRNERQEKGADRLARAEALVMNSRTDSKSAQVVRIRASRGGLVSQVHGHHAAEQSRADDEDPAFLPAISVSRERTMQAANSNRSASTPRRCSSARQSVS